MARVKRGVHAKKNHKAVLEDAKGFYGNRSRVFRAANEAVMHSKQYASTLRAASRTSATAGSSPDSTLLGLRRTARCSPTSP